MIKAIIFDMDGTLVDTLIDLHLSVNYILKKYNYPERTYAEVKSFVGNGLDKLLQRALPKGKCEEWVYIYQEFLDYYAVHAMDNIKPYDGITDMLMCIKEKNILIGCVTNKVNDVANKIVDKYFKGLIDITVGMQVQFNKKPAPDMCNYVINKFNIGKEDVLYVGDSDVDYQTALNSNLTCVSCTWGFRTKSFLESIGSLNFIDKPMQIINFLK